MKSILFIGVLVIGCLSGVSAQDNTAVLKNYWQIGFGLGELPMGGSFKPSITVGYHINEKIYAGLIYQFKDKIKRDGTSFNAKSTGLDGLLSASENVAQRFMFQARFTPVKRGPYLSTGFVFNGEDKETMVYDNRSRNIEGEQFEGNIIIDQTRAAGWGFALGIGHQYNFSNGFSANAEWTPAWLQYPEPQHSFDGTSNLSEEATADLESKMIKGFNSSVTNMYKEFHIGVAYRFN